MREINIDRRASACEGGACVVDVRETSAWTRSGRSVVTGTESGSETGGQR